MGQAAALAPCRPWVPSRSAQVAVSKACHHLRSAFPRHPQRQAEARATSKMWRILMTMMMMTMTHSSTASGLCAANNTSYTANTGTCSALSARLTHVPKSSVTVKILRGRLHPCPAYLSNLLPCTGLAAPVPTIGTYAHMPRLCYSARGCDMLLCVHLYAPDAKVSGAI